MKGPPNRCTFCSASRNGPTECTCQFDEYDNGDNGDDNGDDNGNDNDDKGDNSR